MISKYFIKTGVKIVLIFTAASNALHCGKTVSQMNLVERAALCMKASPEDIEAALQGSIFNQIRHLFALSENEQAELTSMLIALYSGLYPVVYNPKSCIKRNLNNFGYLTDEGNLQLLRYSNSQEFTSEEQISTPQIERLMHYVNQLTADPAIDTQYIIIRIVGAIHCTQYHTLYAAQVTLQNTSNAKDRTTHTLIGCDIGTEMEQVATINTHDTFDHVTFKCGDSAQDIFVVFSNKDKKLCLQPEIYNDAKDHATLVQMLFLLMLEKLKNKRVIYSALNWSFTSQLSNSLAMPYSVHMTLDILNSFITPQVTLTHIYTMLHHAGYIYFNDVWKSPTCELL